MAKSIIPSEMRASFVRDEKFIFLPWITPPKKSLARARWANRVANERFMVEWALSTHEWEPADNCCSRALKAQARKSELWDLRFVMIAELNGAGRLEQKKMENLSETSAKQEEMRWWFRQNDDGGRSAKTNNLIHSNLPMVKWCATMWKCLLFFCFALFIIRDFYLWLFGSFPSSSRASWFNVDFPIKYIRKIKISTLCRSKVIDAKSFLNSLQAPSSQSITLSSADACRFINVQLIFKLSRWREKSTDFRIV